MNASKLQKTRPDTQLQALCAATQRPPSELVRLLIRMAQPADVAPVRFAVLDAPRPPALCSSNSSF